MNEYSGTKQRGCICAFNMLMCAVVIGLAGTLGAGTVTRASRQRAIDATAARGGGKVTVPAGSATYAAAERAAREHPELVGRLIRAQGEKTELPQ